MLYFVLTEPAVPENVGAACRAVKTMGFDQLWVVNSEAHRHKQARILAHGSGDILDNIRTFNSLADVKAAVDILVGTSAKPRHQREVLLSPAQLHHNLQDKLQQGADIALAFGREDSGLHGHEIALCDLLTAVPMAVSYPSLNLSQAVMLYAYELSGLAAPATATSVDANQYKALRDKTARLAQQLGYDEQSKLQGWLHEHLPLLDTRSLGFVHQLVDKTLHQLDKPED